MPVEANVNRGAPRLIVGVGASAGGLDACKPLLADLPPNAGLTIVVILHLDPSRASYLHEILGFQGTLPVMQVTEPTPIERDHIYVIAPGTALSIEDGELRPGA